VTVARKMKSSEEMCENENEILSLYRERNQESVASSQLKSWHVPLTGHWKWSNCRVRGEDRGEEGTQRE